MKKENDIKLNEEILEEEYKLGKDYYDKIIDNAKEEHKEKYK